MSELIPSDEHPLADQEIALVDLLDRVLAGGVVLAGDLTLSIANVDLVHISLRALITSVRSRDASPWNPFSNDPPVPAEAPRRSPVEPPDGTRFDHEQEESE